MEEISLPQEIWHRLHGLQLGGRGPLSPKRAVIYTLSMQWQASPAVAALASYSLTTLQIEIF